MAIELTGNVITNNEITLTGNITAGTVIAAVNWGNIKGTLANQTDLQTALDAKQDIIPAYIKSAQVDNTGNKLTLTKQDNTTVLFTPETGKVDDVTYNSTSLVQNKIAILDDFITGEDSIQGTTLPINADTLDNHDSTYFQQALVSGTNIKTVNNNSILGSGNIDVGGNDFVVNITYNGSTPVSDKTYRQIAKALEDGKVIVAIDNEEVIQYGNPQYLRIGTNEGIVFSSVSVTGVFGDTITYYLFIKDDGTVAMFNINNANKYASTEYLQLYYRTASAQDTIDNTKVDKVTGKDLSTNDYTTEEKTKLSNIEAGAQVNTVISVDGSTGAIVLNDVKYISQTLSSAQQAQVQSNIGIQEYTASEIDTLWEAI